MPRLLRRAYSLPADELARRVLGCTLVRVIDGERLAGVIVEAEAYMGAIDRASHAYGNRRTARTEPMFGPPGTSYVYFTYGMHHCMNVSAMKRDDPQAVLIRALRPVDGLEAMRRNRALETPLDRLKPRDLCGGPARLCYAMRLDRAHSGIDMVESEELFIEGRGSRRVPDIVSSPRIGIRGAGEWTLRPLRFSLREDPHVSVPVRA